MTRTMGHTAVVLTACFLAYLSFALPLLPVAADDIRMVSVFSIDEADIATQVNILFKKGLQERPSFKYGGAFYYPPLIVLKSIALLGDVSERTVMLTVRAFCCVAGAGCLWMTYVVGRAVFGGTTGLVGMALLLINPTFLRWTVEAHPDLPQLFWLLCGLYFCCRLSRAFDVKRAACASLFAGAAFGTKFAGGFLLPVVALAVLLPDENGYLDPREGLRRLTDRRSWLALLAIPAAFALAFAVTNPHAVMHLGAFRDSLLAEKEIMGFGHRVRQDRPGISWLADLSAVSGQAHTLAFAGYAIAGAGYALYRRRRLPADRGLLLVWIGIFLAYLMLASRLHRARHLLPVLPCVLLFAADAYTRIWRFAAERSGPARWAVALLLVPVAFSWGHLSGAAGTFQHRGHLGEGRAEIAAGKWLAGRFPPETSILYDAYAYIPGKFQLVYRTIGQSYPMVAHFEPDLLVVRDAIENDYRDREEAGLARIGARAFLDRHYFYRYLREGRIPTYRLLKSFGDVGVYERAAPRVREEDDLKARWWGLVRHYTDNRVYGLVSARWTMGHIHASLGLADEARQEFKLAREAVNFGVRVYKHGLRELAAGRFEAARGAFDAALESTASEPDSYRASMRADLARRYFSFGYFREAVVQGEAALALNPHLAGARHVVEDARRALQAHPDVSD